MPARIAVVDQRLDLLSFLKEKLEARGYEIIPCLTEDEADAIEPEPDLVVVDFEKQVDLDQVLEIIKDGLESR